MITPQKMNKHDPIKRHLKISLRLDISYAIDLFLRISIQIIVTSPILIQHNPYKNQASFAQVIDPIYSHASYFGKSIGLNKRTVPINRTGSSNRHQRVLVWTNQSPWIFFYKFQKLLKFHGRYSLVPIRRTGSINWHSSFIQPYIFTKI